MRGRSAAAVERGLLVGEGAAGRRAWRCVRPGYGILWGIRGGGERAEVPPDSEIGRAHV